MKKNRKKWSDIWYWHFCGNRPDPSCNGHKNFDAANGVRYGYDVTIRRVKMEEL